MDAPRHTLSQARNAGATRTAMKGQHVVFSRALKALGSQLEEGEKRIRNENQARKPEKYTRKNGKKKAQVNKTMITPGVEPGISWFVVKRLAIGPRNQLMKTIALSLYIYYISCHVHSWVLRGHNRVPPTSTKPRASIHSISTFDGPIWFLILACYSAPVGHTHVFFIALYCLTNQNCDVAWKFWDWYAPGGGNTLRH